MKRGKHKVQVDYYALTDIIQPNEIIPKSFFVATQ